MTITNKIKVLKEKEFNLSKKICKESFTDFVYVEDIKEFIKRLRIISLEWLGRIEAEDFIKEIDKLAGDKLR